ncbi:hypothetical protein [Nocardia yunnanensis]|uniref:hypothetical protein n=1 Tax=Nocardia yunnanensis TaxID=2382165 RepID=UPI0016569F89|nr:hypothetical protein [Nocardia yunnanensis]
MIAEFTKIIEGRHRSGESTATLKYWLSAGIPSPYGAVSAQDFTRWESWLQDTGAIHDKLDASKFFTNKFNTLAPQYS